MKQRLYRLCIDLLWKLGFEETSFKLYLRSIKREPAPSPDRLPAEALKRYDPELELEKRLRMSSVAKKSGERDAWRWN